MTDNAQVVITPTVARFARRSMFWVLMAVILVVLAIAGTILDPSVGGGEPMSATNSSRNGAMALVEVLRDEGVEVTVTDSLDETADAVRDPENTTVFFYDFNNVLGGEQQKRLLGLVTDFVLLDPWDDNLALVSRDVVFEGVVDETLPARCAVDAAQAAEEIAAYGSTYRILDEAEGVEGCFSSDDDVYSLVQVTTDGTRYTVLGSYDALSNGEIVKEGNAALGLNLLGANDHLIWYLPGIDDVDTELNTAAELSPDWVVPVSLVAFLVALAAIFWRGRRLGPLVVENLPVIVRASETMRGRARLYERSNARLHTLDSLRIGTISRLATLCGLPALASVDQVVLASAAAAGLDVHEVRRILLHAEPTSDRALVRLSDELLDLEHLVARNLRPN